MKSCFPMKKQILLLSTALLLTLFPQDQEAQTSVTTKPGQFKEWAQTPPMGWNSWDCYGPTVVESEVKANAD